MDVCNLTGAYRTQVRVLIALGFGAFIFFANELMTHQRFVLRTNNVLF
jgi:hypothetical protein